MEDRLLYINDELDKSLIDKIINGPVEATRCFLLVLNEMQVRNRQMFDKDIYYHNGEQYLRDEWCMIIVPFKKFKEYGIIKNNRSIKDIKDVLNKMYITYGRYIDIEGTCFDNKEKTLTVTFRYEYMLINTGQSLLYPRSKYDKFIIIDLLQFTQLRSKIQILIYMKLMQFQKSRVVMIKIDEIREILETPLQVKELIRKIKNAIAKLEEVMQIKITLDTVKKGRNITSIELNF